MRVQYDCLEVADLLYDDLPHSDLLLMVLKWMCLRQTYSSGVSEEETGFPLASKAET